jgi:plastocyanin
MVKKRLLFSIALLVITLVALAACSSYGSKAPSIEITSPVNGSTIPVGNVTVSIQVSNFKLVDKLGQANVSGEGHIHYFLDYPAPTEQGKAAIPPAGTKWAATPAASYTFDNVGPGSHTIYVELVNNDHTPLNPPVVESVTFTVSTASTPTPTTTAQSVTINLVAHNIAFNQSTITVPACANVTVNFSNEDSGIQHNFAVYTNSSATTAIFTGQVIVGVSNTVYHFTAPCTPGTYFFRCNIHPTIMFGNFVVTS